MQKLKNIFKNEQTETKIHLFFLAFFCILEVLLITKFQFFFGSNVDWMKQHIVFPNYFRNLFYQTGNLFPNFALHLGSGQNIFYFAYYGLYNPIILISYLFPFVPMGTYIMVSSILLVIISAFLLYYFLKKNDCSNKICFFSSLLLLFSSSYLFHSHRHIMFVNYMPFLILSLIGVWRYFEKKKSGLLIISIFFMILTSYYYSISGLITICLYALYYYLKKEKSIVWKDLMRELLRFLFRIFMGILLSAILLFPIIYVILNGRSSTTFIFDISLLKPHIPLEYLMYGTYGMGLVSIIWISIIYHILFSKTEYKVITILFIFLLAIPIFDYILNGCLYLNGKVFIPFLPLGLFLIASMIKSLPNRKISWKWLFIVLMVSSLLLIGFEDNFKYYYLYGELIVTFFLLWFYQKKEKFYILLPIMIAASINSYYNNIQDDLVTISAYQQQQSYENYDIFNYINQDTNSIFRYQDDLSGANGINFSNANLDYKTTLYSSTTNPNYLTNFYSIFNNNDIYRNCFMLAQTNNLFFQRFMGIRYLLTKNDVPFGYKQIEEYENGTLYENTNIYPIGFSSIHLMNYDEYEELSFEKKLEAYQNNIIISGTSTNPNLNFSISSINLDMRLESQENVEIQQTENGYKIESKKNGKIVFHLENPLTDSSLIIRFAMNAIPSCKKGDTSITINGVMNKLTCRTWKYYNQNEVFDYVLSSNDEITQLIIEFSKGTYDISDIALYEIPNSFFDSIGDITPIQIDFSKTKGDILEGNIKVIEDGYFLFTIPYDNGFTLYVDGKKTPIEKVNEIFIGFPISSGEHVIRLEFKAPYSTLGAYTTMVSGISLIILLVYEKRKRHNMKGTLNS